MGLKEEVIKIAKDAKIAAYKMLSISTDAKNRALFIIAEELYKNRDEILRQNEIDVENAKKKKLSPAFIDRLTLNSKRIDEMLKVLNDVIALPDPVGEITKQWTRPNGLIIAKKRMPLGVIGFIYEARPNVSIEASALTIKSGNAIILRGGSDAIRSNICITSIVQKALIRAGLPQNAVAVITSTDRESITHLVRCKEYVDVIIPRGGLNLIRFIEENTLIPVIRHDQGICHTFVDEFADIDMAVRVCYNAKVQRPGVCNAMETLLVHSNIATKFLPVMAEEYKKANVEMRGCKKTKVILPYIKDAVEEDWRTEYLDLILSIKVVESIDEAIEHINTYGSHHSDAIITSSKENAEKFLKLVDSAACYVNASTRFTDGNEFGLGAEMGISNQKLHVRGPLALEGLTSEKYIIYGTGQIRE
ncbi:MAG: glutamate-5-semialdehyde dehydrogenase [Candidatus Goldbacteria bacterium]|nr:glutamate-5-semialdehyde dehydrogenase [Candidatus Goldiibacteriota bacterium]